MPAARLIVNADDFGLTRGINRAVAVLFAAGALTSATLMANGAAFDDAVDIARANPGLGLGCHIVLTDGIPVSPSAEIPTLLGPDGRTFRPSLLQFVLAVLLGRVREEEVAREATAQIQRLQSAGLTVAHLDTHKHTHIFPRIARPLLQVAERLGIHAVRNPFEQPWSLAVSHPALMRRLQLSLLSRLRERFAHLPQIRSGTVQTTDGTIGISATGRLNEPCLRSLLAAMPEGLWELVCHPGYNDCDLDQVTTRLRETRETELHALLATLSSQMADPPPPNIQLTNYDRLSGSGPALQPYPLCEPA